MNATLPSTTAAADGSETRSLYYWYRNARAWGGPLLWSIRYARDARRLYGSPDLAG